MRKLMETLKRINDDKDIFINTLKGNQKIIFAYDDIDPPNGTRNLDIRGVPTTLGTWDHIMGKALAHTSGQYNDFSVRDITIAFRDAIHELGILENELQFIPAREYSVALYITGSYNYLEELGNYIHSNRNEFNNVDEMNIYKDGGRHFSFPVLRLWWD